MGSNRESVPELGIALPTSSPLGAGHLLSLIEACTGTARNNHAALILLAGRHGPTSQIQNIPLVPLVMEAAPGIPVAPLIIAPVWPAQLLLEQLRSLSLLGDHLGNRLVPVLATGTDQPVPGTNQNQGQLRGIAMDIAFEMVLDEGLEPWVAAESGPALRRAARARGWISNATYDDDELTAQLDVVGSVPIRAVRRDIICSADGKDATARADQLLAEGYRPGMSSRHVIAGDIDECSDEILRLADRGFTHVLLRPMESDPETAATTIDTVFSIVIDARP
ncbi:MAG: hypothetical protein ACRDZM_16550 [Acidimicrobiia bacterium]